MAMMVRERVGLEKTGKSCQVPNNARARLMYYLNCVRTVLDIKDDTVRRLANYEQWRSLSTDDEVMLLQVAVLVSPDTLIGKVFFPSDELCGDSNNEFYELSRVRNMFAVASSIVIGGQTKRVQKIMTFKMRWMNQNFIEPAKELQQRHRARQQAAARARNSDNCAIQ